MQDIALARPSGLPFAWVEQWEARAPSDAALFPEPNITVPKDYLDRDAESKAIAKYYAGFSLPNDPDIAFRQLSSLMRSTHTTKLDYSTARWRYLYPLVDVHPDGKLRGVYTGNVFSPPEPRLRELNRQLDFGIFNPAMQNRELLRTLSAGMRAATERLQYNTEHSVPQTHFDKRGPMVADLNYLFTADPTCNSLRGHLPFGDNGGVDGDHCGSVTDSFEPKLGKGAVARATLGFLVRYPNEISTAEIPERTIAILLDWHRRFPPDAWELHRQAESFKIQGYRNPFIDHPEWVEAVNFRLGLSGRGQ